LLPPRAGTTRFTTGPTDREVMAASAGRLRGKVAVVTGGASGMGRAGATLMAAEGAHVVVADLDAERGQAVAQSIVAAGGEARGAP